MTNSPRSPRLAEVAAEAGVSISTVSKVINGAVDVGETTRARVVAVLEGQQYVRRRKRTGAPTIAMLVRSLTMPSTVEIVQGALVEAQATGARIVLVQHADGDPDRSWIDQVKGKSTDGVIAVHSVLEESERRRLEEQSVALVVINPKDAPHVGAHSVGATNWTGGLVATRHLLDLGHRRIGMLCGDEDSLVSRARVSGYREAIESAGARLASDLTFSGRFTFESGLERGRELLARPDRPTAVFAGSDAQAMGVLEAARLLGISVPEELSVIGFDDLVTASMTAPPLTTIRQPFDLMGAAAIAVTLELIEGRVPQSHHVELATSLIVRGTTARLRGSAEGAWPRT